MQMEVIYEAATEAGFCLVCLGSVKPGEVVRYTVFGTIHEDCDRFRHGWGDE